MNFIKNSKEKIMNTMLHLTIDHQPHPLFYLLLHILMTLQIMATLTHQSCHFFLIVKWFDPSNYISSAITVTFCTILIFLFVILLFLRLVTTEED